MSIPVTCPNGHSMKVKDTFAGKTGLCPSCRAPIKVPIPEAEKTTGDVPNPKESELSGITPEPIPETTGGSAYRWSEQGVSQPGGKIKVCPKCQSEISFDANICPNCKTYVPNI